MTTLCPPIRKPAHDQRIITLQSCGFALQTASVVVGPSTTNELTVTVTGIRTWAAPSAPIGFQPVLDSVFLQASQSQSQDFGFRDQFALQVIGWQDAGLNNIQLTFKILRLDVACKRPLAQDSGWGQDLQVDMLMVTHQQEVIQ